MSSKKKKSGNRSGSGTKSSQSARNNKTSPAEKPRTDEPAKKDKDPVTNPAVNEADDRKVIPTTVKTIAGQIVEVAPKEPDEDDELHEDNLEMSQLSFRQRWAVKKQRIKKEMEGMARMQKVEYLLSYFKWHLIFIIGGILIAALFIVAIKTSSRPVALSIAFANMQEYEITEENFSDYKAYTSPDGQNTEDIGIFKVENTVHFDLDTYEQQYNNDPYDFSLTQFPALCTTDFYDVLITDRAGLEFCSTCSIALDPETIISPETVLALRKYQVDAPDSTGKNYFYAYDISETAFAKSLGIRQKLYMAFPCSGDGNKYNAERFLRYIFDLK